MWRKCTIERYYLSLQQKLWLFLRKKRFIFSYRLLIANGYTRQEMSLPLSKNLFNLRRDFVTSFQMSLMCGIQYVCKDSLKIWEPTGNEQCKTNSDSLSWPDFSVVDPDQKYLQRAGSGSEIISQCTTGKLVNIVACYKFALLYLL